MYVNGLWSSIGSGLLNAGRAAVNLLPALTQTYAAVQNVNLQKKQLRLLSAQAPATAQPAPTPIPTAVPTLPNQPYPGNPATVQNPTFVQPTPIQTNGTTLGIPEIQIGGVNATPLLLIGSVLAIVMLTARKE